MGRQAFRGDGLPVQHGIYDAGKKAVFQCLDFAGDIPGAVARGNRALGLENDRPLVVVLIDVVDSDSGLALGCGADGFVYPHAVHPLAPVQREQRRVYVDDPPGELRHEGSGDFPEETG